MVKNLLKTAVLIIAVLFINTAVFAHEQLKAAVNINQQFSPDEIPREIKFTAKKEIKCNGFSIPGNSIITAEPLEAVRERRWHKSGFIVLRLKNYTPPFGDNVNLENEKIYLTARKYEKIDGKEAALTGAEIAAASAASFFIPCIDIAYYFTKGAVQREKNPNWFKAGVSNVYDNSIFWFWLKGKPIELEAEENVLLKEINEKKAYKLQKLIIRRKSNKIWKDARKKAKKAEKQLKKLPALNL